MPLAGIIMPFTKYTYRDGIFGSKWVGLKNFTTLFRSPAFGKLIRNTVSYSTSFIIIGHVIAIFTALMLYELSGKKLKKLYQTSMMIPNFLSWVIVGYVTYAILHPSFGFLRQIRDAMGLPYYDVYVLPLQRIILQQKGSGQTIFLHQRDLLLHRQCQIQGALPGLRAANEMHEIQPIIQEKHPSFFFAAAIISTWETLRQ